MASTQQLQELLTPRLDGSASDLLLCLYIGVALLGVRLVCERLLVPPTRAALKSSGVANADKAGFKVFDDAYTAISSGAMVAWAWEVMLFHNGDCLPWHTSTCVAGWPNLPVTHEFRVFWLAMAGYYTSELLGTVLGCGTILSIEMVVHHVVTMGLMASAYFHGLHRHGLMATALVDISNPLLHAAKAINHTGLPKLNGVKDAAFKLFALVFFVARVIAFPLACVVVGFKDGGALPALGYWFNNALMVVIFGMQLFWFYKIVSIAMGGSGGSTKTKVEQARDQKAEKAQ